MEFLVLLVAGFHWKINPIAQCGISGNATGCALARDVAQLNQYQ
jgi:hypothetical protein